MYIYIYMHIYIYVYVYIYMIILYAYIIYLVVHIKSKDFSHFSQPQRAYKSITTSWQTGSPMATSCVHETYNRHYR